MAAERSEVERAEASSAHARSHTRHPGTREYVRIAIVLGVVTAAEVAIYYIDWVHDNGVLIPLLFMFAVLKFTLVVLWFMHLRFDSRTYARFFVMGLAGAITLFLVMLMIFQTFSG
jgi:cytochrome c oxidase subunit 4